jgi:hypothetical protein
VVDINLVFISLLISCFSGDYGVARMMDSIRSGTMTRVGTKLDYLSNVFYLFIFFFL